MLSPLHVVLVVGTMETIVPSRRPKVFVSPCPSVLVHAFRTGVPSPTDGSASTVGDAPSIGDASTPGSMGMATVAPEQAASAAKSGKSRRRIAAQFGRIVTLADVVTPAPDHPAVICEKDWSTLPTPLAPICTSSAGLVPTREKA